MQAPSHRPSVKLLLFSVQQLCTIRHMTEPEAVPAVAEEQKSATQVPPASEFGNRSRYQVNADAEDYTDGSEDDLAPDPDGDFAAGRFTFYESSEEFLAALEALI